MVHICSRRSAQASQQDVATASAKVVARGVLGAQVVHKVYTCRRCAAERRVETPFVIVSSSVRGDVSVDSWCYFEGNKDASFLAVPLLQAPCLLLQGLPCVPVVYTVHGRERLVA